VPVVLVAQGINKSAVFRKNTERTTELADPIQSVSITARFRHYHTYILARIVSNSNVPIKIIKFNLLNPHFIHITINPIPTGSSIMKNVSDHFDFVK